MKGVDTNVLVRYIVQDDQKQSQLATSFIEQESAEPSIFINAINFCELVWVFESVYEYSRADIASVIEQILRTRQFQIVEPEMIWQALWGYRHTGADFADHYIAAVNQHAGCEFTVTFDKKASKLKHFNLLS